MKDPLSRKSHLSRGLKVGSREKRTWGPLPIRAHRKNREYRQLSTREVGRLNAEDSRGSCNSNGKLVRSSSASAFGLRLEIEE